MTTPLAVTADVVKILGRPLAGTDETNKATELLLLASAEVNRYTGFRFAPGDYTISRLLANYNRVKLPAVVDSVTSVIDVNPLDGTTVALVLGTDYTVRGRMVYFMRPHYEVEIAFHVIAAVPDVVKDVVAGCVAYCLSGPPIGASAEAAGPYSITYQDSSGKVWLGATDKHLLSTWKQPKSALLVRP